MTVFSFSDVVEKLRKTEKWLLCQFFTPTPYRGENEKLKNKMASEHLGSNTGMVGHLGASRGDRVSTEIGQALGEHPGDRAACQEGQASRGEQALW